MEEAQARISEADFVDWMLWYELRAEKQQRAAKGETMDDIEDASPEQQAAQLHLVMGLMRGRMEGRG